MPRNGAAAWTYRALERLCQANALPERTQWFLLKSLYFSVVTLFVLARIITW